MGNAHSTVDFVFVPISCANRCIETIIFLLFCVTTVNNHLPLEFMENKQSQVTVTASQLQGILLEKYCYTVGIVEPLPKHSHQEYQLGMSFNCQGEYFYRGAYHPIPIGSLSIIHSGEVHSPSKRTYLPQSASFCMMHVEPNLLQDIASEIGSDVQIPFFTEPVLSDRNTTKLFQNLCLAVGNNVSKLQQDSSMLDFLARLITQNREGDRQYSLEKPAVALICDYLQAHCTNNISLNELANLVGMSRFYLSRLFRREKGISLSAYQTQIRIDRAKKFLSQGMPIAQVATTTGFYDQSHFGHHFKHLVGTTPGNYRKEQ